MDSVSECQFCGAKAELFLCTQHVGELRGALNKLAFGPEVNGRSTDGLLEALADVVLKRTRMGNGSGHRKKGDELPAPFEPDVERLNKNGQVVATAQGRASTLLSATRNHLGTIIRDLCEHRGVECPAISETAEMASWLACNVNAMACDESAGQWWSEVDAIVRQIERAVDRPTRRVWLGDCPTWNERTRTSCGTALWAPEDAVEARCQRCRSTHDPRRLKLLLFSDLERKKITWDKVLLANKSQPIDRQVPERTLQSWRRGGRLKIRGYERPDGSHGIHRRSDDDEPLYLWPDVRKLRDEKPQKLATGGASHKRNRQCDKVKSGT